MRRQAMGLTLGFLCAGIVSVTALTALTAMGQTPAAKPTPAASAKDAGAAQAPADPNASTSASKDGGASTGVATAPASAAPTSPVPGAPAVPIPEKGAMDGASYGVALRNLEARVDELKNQIRNSHTRLALLSDTILSGGAAGSRAEVVFRNEMSSAFRLTGAVFVVDGAIQYNRQDETGALADQKEIPIFNGSIPPGDHTVQVQLKFQGNGYGVFTYLRGYKFEVKSAHSFTAVEGKTISLLSTALEKGGVTTPLEQRPTVEWAEKVGALGAASASAPPAGAAKGQVQTAPGSASGSVQIGGGK